MLLYHFIGEHDGEFGAWAFHKQGNGGFTQVLARAAQSFGAEIRLESPVERSSRRTARRPASRSRTAREFGARSSSSALDPRRTFLELVDPRELPTDLVETIERFRFQGTSAKVNFALDGLPRVPGARRRTDQYRGFTNIGPSMDYLERAFDDAKYGWYSKRPYIDMRDPVDDRPGHGATRQARHVVLRPVRAVPPARDRLGHRAGEPGRHGAARRWSRSSRASATSSCSARSVTPLDIERTVGLSEGNIFAGEFLAPQMFFFRPAPGWSQYRTPIEGYYQCGSGTHPGGCVMGAPGKLAAGQILKDVAKSKKEARRERSLAGAAAG